MSEQERFTIRRCPECGERLDDDSSGHYHVAPPDWTARLKDGDACMGMGGSDGHGMDTFFVCGLCAQERRQELEQRLERYRKALEGIRDGSSSAISRSVARAALHPDPAR